MQVDEVRLASDASDLAVACLLVRAAPAENRHDYLLHIAGGLIRAHRAAADRIHHAVARHILADRYNKAEGERLLDETAARIARKDPACGWPRLVERLGEKRARHIAHWLGFAPGATTGGTAAGAGLNGEAKPEGWADPIDILGDPALAGIGSIDADCLPKSILDHARAEAARLQVDPCHIAALDIGVCSAVIPDGWRIQLKARDTIWAERPAIWIGVVAASGRKKSDCMRSATAPVDKIQDRLRSEFNKELARYTEELHRWENAPKGKKDKKPEEPKETRILTDDYTIETLSDLLQTRDKILVKADELATFLGAADRFGNGTKAIAGRAHMLALYDGGARRIDRVTRGKIFVRNWSAVPVGHIQPERVRPLVADLASDGLLQRFALVMPPVVVTADPDDDDVAADHAAVETYDQVVDRLYSLTPPQREGPLGRIETSPVQATASVHSIRRRMFRLVERVEADPFLLPALKQAVAKWRGLLARLTLVLHLVEGAERLLKGEQLQPADRLELDPATVDRACRFIMRVVAPSTFRFFAELATANENEEHARWVAGFLLSRKLERVTAREIGRGYRTLRGDKRRILATMDQLEHGGWVVPDEQASRGEAWLVNPKVHTLYAEHAKAETARREANRRAVREKVAALMEQGR